MTRVLALTFAAVAAYGQPQGDALYDFRKVAWGMTLAQAQEAEQRAPDAPAEANEVGGKAIGYSTKLVSYKVIAIYSTTREDRLYRGTYVLSERYPAPIQYVQAFNALVGLLTEKYGEPTVVFDNWLQDKDYYDRGNADLGRAVLVGDLTMHRQWKTDRTTINAECMRGAGRSVAVRIDYFDTDTTKALDAAQQATAKGDL